MRNHHRDVPNILIVASEPAAEAALQGVSSLFAGPIQTCVLPGPLQLPRANCVALVLRNVGALMPEQQLELSEWLDSGPRVPVVSVNASSVHALVGNGTFSERLYYRLNIIFEDADTALGTASWLVNGTRREPIVRDVMAEHAVEGALLKIH